MSKDIFKIIKEMTEKHIVVTLMGYLDISDDKLYRVADFDANSITEIVSKYPIEEFVDVLKEQTYEVSEPGLYSIDLLLERRVEVIGDFIDEDTEVDYIYDVVYKECQILYTKKKWDSVQENFRAVLEGYNYSTEFTKGVNSGGF